MAWNPSTDWVKIGDLWWSTKDLDIDVPGLNLSGQSITVVWNGRYYYNLVPPPSSGSFSSKLPDGCRLPSRAEWDSTFYAGHESDVAHLLKGVDFGGIDFFGMDLRPHAALQGYPGAMYYPQDADGTSYGTTPPGGDTWNFGAYGNANAGSNLNLVFLRDSDTWTSGGFSTWAYTPLRIVRDTAPPVPPAITTPEVHSVTPRQVYPGGRVHVVGLNFDTITAVEVPEGANVLEAGKTTTDMDLRIPVSAALGRFPLHLVGTFGELDAGWLEVVAVGGLDPHLPPDRTGDDYRGLLVDLLPKGPAWNRRPNSWLGKLLSAFAEELQRIHTAAADLLAGARPSGALLHLTDWETELGLPGPCSPSLPPTDAARLSQIVQKANNSGGCTAAYFEEVAAIFGYNATVSESYPSAYPFKAGRAKAGDALSQGPGLFQWVVNITIPADSVHVFTAGSGKAGNPLRWWSLEELECFFETLKPAHTRVHFTYTYT